MSAAQIELKALAVEGTGVVLYIPVDNWRAMGSPREWQPKLVDLQADQAVEWVPLELACRQLAKDMGDTSSKGVERARYRIQNDLRSPRPMLRDNGREKRERALEAGSLAAFRLKVRDRLLESDGWGDEE